MCNTNIYGLENTGNSCWLNTVLFSMFYSNRSREIFLSEFGNGLGTISMENINRKEIESLYQKMKEISNKILIADQKIGMECTKHINQIISSINQKIPINKLYLPESLIHYLFEIFNIPSPVLINSNENVNVYDHIIVISGYTDYRISEVFNDETNQILLDNKSPFLIIQSIYNKGLYPNNTLNINIKGGTEGIYTLEGIIVANQKHVISYNKCDDNWIAFDDNLPENGMKVINYGYKFNYYDSINKNHVSPIYAISVNNDKFEVFDYYVTNQSVRYALF